MAGEGRGVDSAQRPRRAGHTLCRKGGKIHCTADSSSAFESARASSLRSVLFLLSPWHRLAALPDTAPTAVCAAESHTLRYTGCGTPPRPRKAVCIRTAARFLDRVSSERAVAP